MPGRPRQDTLDAATVTLEELEAAARAAQTAGTWLTVNFPSGFSPSFPRSRWRGYSGEDREAFAFDPDRVLAWTLALRAAKANEGPNEGPGTAEGSGQG